MFGLNCIIYRNNPNIIKLKGNKLHKTTKKIEKKLKF